MNSMNELLSAVKDAKKNLKEGTDFRVGDTLSVFEGIAPFLDRETVIAMKCKKCDNYASAFFPLTRDFWAVDSNEYCHAKSASLKNLTAVKVAGCMEYSQKAQEKLKALASAMLEEDLQPALGERKLYNRSKFASYNVAFQLSSTPGKVCIEFGHRTKEGFEGSDIKLYILSRLDPGFGALASQKIAEAIKNGPAIVVNASLQVRRQLDIDYVLEWIARKRNMEMVYL